MELITKFNVNDLVWVMKDNKPHQFPVYAIEIEIHRPQTIRENYVEYIQGSTSLDKSKEYRYYFYECFATKQELLDSFND